MANSRSDEGHELRPPPPVRVAGMPNLEIQVEKKALTQTSVEKEDSETTSCHQVVLFIIVKRKDKFLFEGRGPTISMFTLENL